MNGPSFGVGLRPVKTGCGQSARPAECLLRAAIKPSGSASIRLTPQQGGRICAAQSALAQISVCSEISRASSTSMPKYLTVDSSFEWPSSNCTARRFLVRR